MKTFKFKDFFGKTKTERRMAVSKKSIQKCVDEIIKRETVKEGKNVVFVPKVTVSVSVNNNVTKKITHE